MFQLKTQVNETMQNKTAYMYTSTKTQKFLYRRSEWDKYVPLKWEGKEAGTAVMYKTRCENKEITRDKEDICRDPIKRKM